MSQDVTTTVVPFQGDEITCVETPNGVMVAIRPICDAIGVDVKGQRKRLAGDQERWRGGLISSPSAGGEQETYCIPLTKLAAWLASISASRVKPEVRERLVAYQTEADEVLDRHFRRKEAEKDAEIEALEKMLWHSHQQLKVSNPKWARAFAMMEMGHSDYFIAKRCNWTSDDMAEEHRAMRRAGFDPACRHDMKELVQDVTDLHWELDAVRRLG